MKSISKSIFFHCYIRYCINRTAVISLNQLPKFVLQYLLFIYYYWFIAFQSKNIANFNMKKNNTSRSNIFFRTLCELSLEPYHLFVCLLYNLNKQAQISKDNSKSYVSSHCTPLN